MAKYKVDLSSLKERRCAIRSGLFLSLAPHGTRPVHLFWNFFFFLTLPVFMISVGKRLVTSTNLEYFFPFSILK